MKQLTTLILFILFCSHQIKAENFEPFFNSLKNLDYSESEVLLSDFKGDLKHYLNVLLKTLRTRKQNNDIIEILNTDSNELKIIKHLIRGHQFILWNDSDHKVDAFNSFSEALKLANSLKIQPLSKAALIGLLDLLKQEFFLLGDHFNLYLNQFETLSSDSTDNALLIMYKAIFSSKAGKNLEIDYDYYQYANQLDQFFQKIPKKSPLYAYYYYEKAINFKIINEHSNSAFYFKKADSLARKFGFLKTLRPVIAWQMSDLYLSCNNSVLAKQFLHKSMSLATSKKDQMYDIILYSRIYAFDEQNDFAFDCAEEANELRYALKYESSSFLSNIQSEINETHKIKLEKQDALAKSKQNFFFFLSAIGVLILSLILAYQLYKNTKRKQLLAEQEKALETQKLTTVLKEQELTSIDAMIAGQEKERQRIANDLHDDLGSLMATVKLHISALKGEATPQLFDKTLGLIDETYHKIRSISHERGSGVMADKSLLKAIKDMANSTSISKNLNIEVIDYGLDQPLENSLELTLFRIVQELITNIIKHAKATEASIHITHHDQHLNLMVEDNGLGFDPKGLTHQQGMGIRSIDKRIDSLGGTITIESEAQKGTTVIIDIPIL